MGHGTRASANTAWYELKKKLIRIAAFIKPGETPTITINATNGVMGIIPAASSLAVDTQSSNRTTVEKKSSASEKYPAKSVAPQPIPGLSKQKVNSKRKQLQEAVEEETSPLPKRPRSTRLSTSQTTTNVAMAVKQPPRINLVHKASKKTEATPAKKGNKKTKATTAKQANEKPAKGINNRSTSVSGSSVDDQIPGQRITEIQAQKNMKKALADFIATDAKKGETYDLKSEFLFDLNML